MNLIAILSLRLFDVPLFFIFVLLVLVRPITVFIHELGHALAGILLTKKKVSVYIGSYGDKERSFKIPLKILDIYIYRNPLKWVLGLCVTENNMTIKNQMFYTFAGPLISLLTAGISYILITKTDILEVFFTLLLISSLIDFVNNIIPSKKMISLADGRTTYNDGRSLIRLFELSKLPKEYVLGIGQFNNKNYHDAANIFEGILMDHKNPDVYRIAIVSHLQSKNYERAKDLSESFKSLYEMNSDDLANHALVYTQSGLLSEALSIYDASLKINPNNKFSLNNKGYTLLLLEKYEDSMPLFDKAITIDKNFSYSYNNRGLAKLKLNLLEEGLKDIEDSLQLDTENPDAYKNLGIYYYEKKDNEKALQLFLKAKELDEATESIDELLELVRKDSNNKI